MSNRLRPAVFCLAVASLLLAAPQTDVHCQTTDSAATSSDSVKISPFDAPPVWKRYDYRQANMIVSFPITPAETKDKIGKFDRYTYKASHSIGTFQATSIALPTSYNKDQSNQIIAQMARDFIRANGLTIKEKQDYSNGTAGREYTLEKALVDMRYRIFIRGSWLYQLVISARTDKIDYEMEQEFFGSFDVSRTGR